MLVRESERERKEKERWERASEGEIGKERREGGRGEEEKSGGARTAYLDFSEERGNLAGTMVRR